ncbi:hypothetical protein CBS101457_000324 [Exobasidium rhododendri]|nr:hypothetical protein CBS101457_000324 [Exobasidium rhododendri]
MSSALPLLSPLVTRILELSGFPPELKTRDIQAIFSQWEDDRGGFKIKWVDDITALVIFADAATAKRAYLQTLMSPPPSLMTSTGIPAKIRPYDGDDAAMIIASIQSRIRSRSNAGIQATPAYGAPHQEEVTATPSIRNSVGGSPRSIGKALGAAHRRNPSGSNPSSLPAKPLAAALFDAANGGLSHVHPLTNAVTGEHAASNAGDSSPEFTHNVTSSAALRSLPLNPMTTAPRSSFSHGSLGLHGSPDRKAGSGLSNGATDVASAGQAV